MINIKISKKISAIALITVTSLALLTGCGNNTSSSYDGNSIAIASDNDRNDAVITDNSRNNVVSSDNGQKSSSAADSTQNSESTTDNSRNNITADTSISSDNIIADTMSNNLDSSTEISKNFSGNNDSNTSNISESSNSDNTDSESSTIIAAIDNSASNETIQVNNTTIVTPSSQAKDNNPVEANASNNDSSAAVSNSLSENVTSNFVSSAAANEPNYIHPLYLAEGSSNYAYAYAYSTGDYSNLDSEETAILNVLAPFLDSIIDYSSDYDKEKAVHDYIIRLCEYDYSRYNSGSLIWNDFHPVGVFIDHIAVCQGYAESFKLALDLLGIQCDIVKGTACNGDAHAWNAVCLYGDWYQVDLTWDDAGEDAYFPISYKYFNVTDSVMKESHNYSYENACNGTQYTFANEVVNYGNYCANANDYYDYINGLLSNGATSATALVPYSKYEYYVYTTRSRMYDTEIYYRFDLKNMSDIVYEITVTPLGYSL